MSHSNRTATITLWINRLVAVILVLLIFFMPGILQWYSQIRALLISEYTAVLTAFYCCAVVVLIALWNMERLLSRILKGEVFVRKNVQNISAVRWCCGLVSLICIPASVFYLPLIFMVIVMAFLCLAVSVLVSVMQAAVAIREENDLTV